MCLCVAAFCCLGAGVVVEGPPHPQLVLAEGDSGEDGRARKIFACSAQLSNSVPPFPLLFSRGPWVRGERGAARFPWSAHPAEITTDSVPRTIPSDGLACGSVCCPFRFVCSAHSTMHERNPIVSTTARLIYCTTPRTGMCALLSVRNTRLGHPHIQPLRHSGEFHIPPFGVPHLP